MLRSFIDCISLFLAAILFCLAATAGLASGRELVFAPLPIEQPESVVNTSRPLITYLSRHLGTPIQIRYESDFKTILRLFREGKIDIAHLGPLPYLSLKQSYTRVEPIATVNESDGSDAYTCALVTAFDGPSSLSQVQGPIALTQPLSTCGHLTAGYLLQKHGRQIESFRHDYLGNQDKVALAVIQGTYQVGTMKTALVKKYANLTLRVLEETPRFPGFLLVANTGTMKPELITKVRAALLSMPAKDREGLLMGQYGFSPVSHQTYDLLRTYQVFFK